jgi:hypothetical protein
MPPFKRAILLSLVLIPSPRALADTWGPPSTVVVVSDDGNIVARVDPVTRDERKNHGTL